MAEVHPLYEIENVAAMRDQMIKFGNVREAYCFYIGCHVGLRASDLLVLKFRDVQDKMVCINEIKTGKYREFPISKQVRQAINALRVWYKDQGVEPTYLFQATGNRVSDRIKPISQNYLLRLIKDAADRLGIEGNFGTHTARKTFGYHLYKKTGDLTNIQKVFQHETQSETLAYIGVTRKTIHDLYLEVDYSA